MPKKLTNVPLYPISHDRSTHFLTCSDTKPWMCTRVAHPYNKKRPSTNNGVACGQPYILGTLQQAKLLAKAGHVVAMSDQALFACNLNGQALTTLRTTALDNQPTIFTGHPYEKTMGTLAGNVAGLKCSFHGCTPSTDLLLNSVLRTKTSNEND